MTLQLDDDARIYLWWDGTLTADPTGSTLALEVTTLTDTQVTGSPFAMTWQGSPAGSGSSWTQTARTNMKFCGSTVTPVGSDVQPGAGAYRAQVIVTTSDGQIITAPAERLVSS